MHFGTLGFFVQSTLPAALRTGSIVAIVIKVAYLTSSWLISCFAPSSSMHRVTTRCILVSATIELIGLDFRPAVTFFLTETCFEGFSCLKTS